MKVSALYEQFKYDALAFIGAYETPPEDLHTALANVVSKHGVRIYSDCNRLVQVMKEEGLSEGEAYQICVMTTVPGFQEILKNDSRTERLDLERYILNAVQRTGFDRRTILRLTSGILYSIGGAHRISRKSKSEEGPTANTIAILASSVYENILNDFQEALDQVIMGGNEEIALDFNSIFPLAQFGIARAKYFLGFCLLYGIQVEQNEEAAMQYLQEAADTGDPDAAGVLGDLCYESEKIDGLSKAYDYYTGNGAPFLNQDRKQRVVEILNQKRHNKRIIGASCLLFLAMLVTVIWAPGSWILAARAFWGWTSVVLEAALLVLAVLHFRAKPFDKFERLPFLMLLPWFIYFLIRVIS